MISRADVDKLLEVRAAGPSVLSLYLWVPLDPAELRGLPALAGELFALAARDGPGVPAGVRVGAADARAVRTLLASRARDWLGHTVAVFTCAELGLAEAIPLPCGLQERAVLAARPHVRPLLLAIQRCPAYRVAVVDHRHAWLFSIADGQIGTAVLPPAEGMRSHGFSGWYGLEAHRVNERIIQLARHHYRDTATLLERTSRASGAEPLVIGGHQDTIPQFLAVLPPGLRDQFAGSFVADPHTLTPAKVRDLSDRVIRDWGNLQDERIAGEFLREPPDGRTVTGLSACLAAAGQHAIQLLLVPAGGLVPGYACQRCGALSSTGDGCPHGATGSLAVPDLIEEAAVATLGDGGQVETLPDPPGGIAARLRYAMSLRDTRPSVSIVLPGLRPAPAKLPISSTDAFVAAAGDVPGLPIRWRPRGPPGSGFAGVRAAAPAVGVVDLHRGIGCCRGAGEGEDLARACPITVDGDALDPGPPGGRVDGSHVGGGGVCRQVDGLGDRGVHVMLHGCLHFQVPGGAISRAVTNEARTSAGTPGIWRKVPVRPISAMRSSQ